MTVLTENFVNSIGVNTHMSYTDGAYANVANVVADLAYLGIRAIRDAVPNPNGGIPAANQIDALNTLAADGIKFDLLVSPSLPIAQTVAQINGLENASPGSIIAIEGPNEINNNPVTYDGLSGQAGALAFQAALYQAVKANPATANVAVYDFTGGVSAPITVAGINTRNANGSYTIANGQTGFPVTLPEGISSIKLTYTGSSGASGLFSYPGQGQVTSITNGSNGTISYTYDNTSGATQSLYVDFIDWGNTDTLTNVSVTGPNSTANLVTFDPNLSLAGLADDANIHPYPYGNAPIGPIIASNYETAFGGTAPGPRVITETGFTTDPGASNGVTEIEQAQQIVNGLFDAYESGVATTYIYELLDEKSDPSDSNSQMHYGLFTNDNAPKQAAVAIHNLTTILSDTATGAASFQPGTLNFTETGASSSDNAMLLEKSSGVFDIALWNDADPGTENHDMVTISLPQSYLSVTVYDVVTGVAADYSNVSNVSLNLGGDAMIVEVDPHSPAAGLNTAAITSAVLNEIKMMKFLAPPKLGPVSAASPLAVGLNIATTLGSASSESFLSPAVSAGAAGRGYFKTLMAEHAASNPLAIAAAMLAKLH